MTPKEKHQEEQNELKSSRINRILESAFNLFSEKGIDTITMNDIAATAEIGVASLYRYFATKDEIAIRTAIWAWENHRKMILPILDDTGFYNKNGIEQLAEVFELFCKLYQNEPSFFRYIYFFDAYIICQKIDSGRLIAYQNVIEAVQKIIENAIIKGIEDGSISARYKGKENQLYYSLMHTIFAASQKLSLSGKMLKMDETNDDVQQLILLYEVLLGGLK